MTLSTVKGSPNITLQTTHSIDINKHEISSTNAVNRKIKDTNFGGQGEKVTLVPSIQAISIYGANSSFCSSTASEAMVANAGDMKEMPLVVFARLTVTNIKGVK